MDAFEIFQLRELTRRALDRKDHRGSKRPTGALAAWICDHAQTMGLPLPAIDAVEIADVPGRINRATWQALNPVVEHLSINRASPPASGLEKRLDWLSTTLGLSPVEADILKVAVRAAMMRPIEQLADTFEPSASHGDISPTGLAVLAGRNGRSISHALLPGRSLQMMGLLEDRCGDFAPSQTVMRIARLRTSDPEKMRAVLMGKQVKPELAWEDFSHLGEGPDRIQRLVDGALRQRASGVNILLYGEPGTGKTEFVRTLADRISATVSFVGETDDDNEEPTRASRVAAFALARSLVGCVGRGLLVVDEADDIFTGVDEEDAASRRGSKVFMNRMVERTVVPTIWITNHPERLGPAVLRRMSFALAFPKPGRLIRERMIERIAARRRLKLPPAGLAELASIAAAPAILDNAMRVGRLTGGGVGEIAAAARSISQAMEGVAPPANKPPIAFDPALSAADHDLGKLADRVSVSGQMAISFCLHGLPGTGKSAFARYVAERLGLDVLEKRASDLLSMWVGGSEKQIAAAFQEAADTRAMLIIDEADSLLRDRAGARQSHEVTQVNEMLTWMERHPYPFACTTNLMESLDPATLRRFLFKVKFLPMTKTQAREAFQRHFHVEAPKAIDNLDLLAPDDFALVARKAKLLDEDRPDAILAMLSAEAAAKPNAVMQKMGFAG